MKISALLEDIIKFGMAKYVDKLHNRDYSLNENVTFYAFLT